MTTDPVARVAIVTGASRGIGRGCALALARTGFDVVLAARTVTGEERLEHSPTIRRSDESPLPGSLGATADEVRRLGRRAVVVPFDLERPDDWPRPVAAAIETFGRIDVLVNNARYVGPGHMDAFEATPIELFERMLRCNVIAPLALIQHALPHWKRQGGGIVINVTSAAGQTETPRPIGEGGWGLGYSISKAAFSRMIPGLAKELKPSGVAIIGLMPGFVATERTAVELRDFGFDTSTALSVDNPGRVCALLATSKDPMHFTGRDLRGPELLADHEHLGLDG